MSGQSASNRISTTLPRTEITAPNFEGAVVFFMFAFADPPSIEFRPSRVFPSALSHSTFRRHSTSMRISDPNEPRGFHVCRGSSGAAGIDRTAGAAFPAIASEIAPELDAWSTRCTVHWNRLRYRSVHGLSVAISGEAGTPSHRS